MLQGSQPPRHHLESCGRVSTLDLSIRAPVRDAGRGLAAAGNAVGEVTRCLQSGARARLELGKGECKALALPGTIEHGPPRLSAVRVTRLGPNRAFLAHAERSCVAEVLFPSRPAASGLGWRAAMPLLVALHGLDRAP